MKHQYPHTSVELDENQWEETTQARFYDMLVLCRLRKRATAFSSSANLSAI